jgi:hypothetical protein
MRTNIDLNQGLSPANIAAIGVDKLNQTFAAGDTLFQLVMRMSKVAIPSDKIADLDPDKKTPTKENRIAAEYTTFRAP